MSFSKSKINLIESANDIVIQVAAGTKMNHPTFSENVCNSLTSIYDNYLKKYAILWIIIICAIVFLLYRYYKNKEVKRKRVEDVKNNTSSEEIMTRRIYEILQKNNAQTNNSITTKKS
jgi:large-conductance mechanosensitive channel